MNTFQIIGEIMALGTIINENTKHTVFMELVGHINKLEIRMYLNGWKAGADSDLVEDIYIEDLKGLQKARQQLLKMVLENDIDTSKLPYEIQTIEIKKYKLLEAI